MEKLEMTKMKLIISISHLGKMFFFFFFFTLQQEHHITCGLDSFASDPSKQTTVSVSYLLTE